VSTRRKMLAADERIANRIVDMAKRRESTVYQTVNDILEQALRVEEMDLSLDEVVSERGMIEKARKMGLTFTMENLLYDVVELAYDNSKDKLSDMWREVGSWYGKFFSNKANDGLGYFEEAMTLLTLGNPVFNIEREKKDIVTVSCVGEGFTHGFTSVLSLFIEGVFETFGMKLDDKENSKGIIRLRFKAPR
jgi:hypothetical protein